MTTAHRPTWHAARGNANQGGWTTGSGTISAQFSARDLPGQTTLKFRQPGQGTVDEVESRDLKSELELKELKDQEQKEKEERRDNSIRMLHENRTLLLKNHIEPDISQSALLESLDGKYDDSDEASNSEAEDSEDDSDDSDSEDEEAELMRELEKIKQEREQERRAKDQQEKKSSENAHEAEILLGNPLTKGASSSSSATLKRKWNDDVVFKNQSRNEPQVQKRFINDVIRSDFHRRFMTKYIQ